MVTTNASVLRARNVTRGLLVATFVIALLNALLYFGGVLSARGDGQAVLVMLFFGVAALQALLGVATFIAAFVYALRMRREGESMASAFAMALFGLFGSAGGVAGGVLGVGILALASAGGGAWGRPLRIRGRVRHPELREGSDWTEGDAPSTEGLDEATCAALEALWLHDAQKEHASVPAFARVAWTLIAVGAPAELVTRTFTAAQEEVSHTRLCFALAAGYGGRSHSVESMPELLVEGLEVKGDAFVHLALESLNDGCLLEDYNADVAAACRDACQEPATGAVLTCIAREERAHAELSWGILEFCLARGGEPVRAALAAAAAKLPAIPRPTAVSAEKQALVARANADALRAHGRLPDSEWARIYEQRLGLTATRLDALLNPAVAHGAQPPAHASATA
jgi:hypothetical protein